MQLGARHIKSPAGHQIVEGSRPTRGRKRVICLATGCSGHIGGRGWPQAWQQGLKFEERRKAQKTGLPWSQTRDNCAYCRPAGGGLVPAKLLDVIGGNPGKTQS